MKSPDFFKKISKISFSSGFVLKYQIKRHSFLLTEYRILKYISVLFFYYAIIYNYLIGAVINILFTFCPGLYSCFGS